MHTIYKAIFLIIFSLVLIIRGLAIRLNEDTIEKYKKTMPGVSPAAFKYGLIGFGMFGLTIVILSLILF